MLAHPFVNQVAAADFARTIGHVVDVTSTHVEANGPLCTIGDICYIEHEDGFGGKRSMEAEVAAVNDDKVILVPFDQSLAVRPNARVVSFLGGNDKVSVGDQFSGRAVNALGHPIDGKPPVIGDTFRRLAAANPKPLERISPNVQLPTGIRSIDTMLSIGKGQRVGIFAAAGVGKTSLVEQLFRQIKCDRTIICLVGERGREVEAVWNLCQNAPNKNQYTLVASTSDESPALRMRAPNYALALAEFWRARGEHVLLILDSATRMAMAMREMGLAAGEPPTIRAYTPGVFSAIPRFVERCGALKSGGAITAIMTILAETDDIDDPIAEMMKAVLDGHIILSRSAAEQGHFPAIDIGRSVSRQSQKLLSAAQQRQAAAARSMLAIYEESRTFIESGVYRSGGNIALDRAVALKPKLVEFLCQSQELSVPLEKAFAELETVLGGVL